jgi:TonB family protein
VNKATHPEFGEATIAMVEQWEFEPALKDGRPTRSELAFAQEFSRYDRELVPEAVDDVLTLEQKHPERIVGAGKLDEPLKPTSTRPPVFPVAARGKGGKGEATVEILIDGEGRARLPRVVAASDPAFGWAAVQAVAVWRFEPPTRKGQPVVTRVRIPFEFTETADGAGKK